MSIGLEAELVLILSGQESSTRGHALRRGDVATCHADATGGEGIDISAFSVFFDPDVFEPIPANPNDPFAGVRVTSAGPGGILVATQPSPGEIEVTQLAGVSFAGPVNVANLFLIAHKSGVVSCDDFVISGEVRNLFTGAIPGVGVTCSTTLE